MFTIDGIEWDYPCTVERTAKVTSSEISGMLLNKQYFNDVLGTWMQYAVTVAVPFGREEEYTDLYETLTYPKDGHQFVLPYNEGTIQVTGRVSSVSDRWVRSHNHWRQIKFTVTANHPSKALTLGEVISTGMTPIPADMEASIGDLYEYTASGWVQRFYEDAEDMYF